jgi:hypothetical protein
LVKRTDAETLPVLTLKSGENIPVTIDTMPNAMALIKAIVDNDMIQNIRLRFKDEKRMIAVLKEHLDTIDAATNYVSMKTILEPFLTQESTSPETRTLIDHARTLQGQMYDTITYYISQYQRTVRTTPTRPSYAAMPLTAAPSFGFVERQYSCPAANNYNDDDAPHTLAMLRPSATSFA